jgi:hypothetical protein
MPSIRGPADPTWQLRLPTIINLDHLGIEIATLEEARSYILSLPHSIQGQPTCRLAIKLLLDADVSAVAIAAQIKLAVALDRNGRALAQWEKAAAKAMHRG